MIGGVTRHILPYPSGVPHLHVNRTVMCKHRRKSHATLKSFWDISFTRHPDQVQRKKIHNTLINTTDNQNVNATKMKYVKQQQQQQHFLFKTASQSDWNVSEDLCFLCVCSVCFLVGLEFKKDERASGQVWLIILTFYRQSLELLYSLKTCSFHLQSKSSLM